MKKQFFDQVERIMKKNKEVYLIFIGLGYPRVDEFLTKYPDRAINTEASEQTALDIAVGLAYSAKIPVVYTISSFYWRAAETIRTYLDHESLPCVLVGAGRGEEYGVDDGFSHSASDLPKLFNLFKKFKKYYPDTIKELKSDLKEAIESGKPCFVNIHR